MPSSIPKSASQHPLWLSILLHLFPGLVFGIFLMATIPILERRGVDPLFALFGGIGLVIVPLELGYLAIQAHRSIGSWSPMRAVGYRTQGPRRKLVPLQVALVLWFIVVLIGSIAVADTWLADNLFSWLPESILGFSAMEGDVPAAWTVVAVLALAFVFNGVVGPITEELYFRGHLLPRIDRYGSRAPILNTVLFALYHIWTPWRWPAIIVGFLPTTWQVWRRRSIYVSIAVHVAINLVFLLMMTASFLS